MHTVFDMPDVGLLHIGCGGAFETPDVIDVDDICKPLRSITQALLRTCTVLTAIGLARVQRISRKLEKQV